MGDYISLENIAYKDAREFLINHKNTAIEPAGESPMTIRWLNSKNTYVNIGLEKDAKDMTIIKMDQNSYGTRKSDLEELANVLREKFDGNKKDPAKA